MSPPPLRTDEPVDRWFSRPLAAVVVKALAPTPVTANQVTCFAAALGVAVGTCLGLGLGLAAAGFIAGYLAFDCVDGQLARLRGGGGYLGRAMDGFGDYVTGLAVHAGLAAWIARAEGWPVGAVLALGAALAMASASFLLDRYKRRYCGTTDDLPAIEREARERGGLSGRLVAGMLPYARRLDGGLVVPDLAVYQARVRLPLRLWLLGGPTMHLTALAACAVAGRPTLYAWIAVGPLLLLTLGTLAVQRRVERRAPAVVAARDPGTPDRGLGGDAPSRAWGG